MKYLPLRLSVVALTLSLVLSVLAAQQPKPKRSPDVMFVPTPHEVVAVMLRLAEVDEKDLLYDLGCGDGRIPVAAAKEYGARAVCIDIDPQRIQEARANAQRAGVTDRVRIVEADLFETDLRDATAVTLYLLNELNLRLRPKLLEELEPGTPIVSHDFSMGDWEPEEEVEVKGPTRTHTVYKWRVPAKAGGTWRWHMPNGSRENQYELSLQQEVQSIRGTLAINGDKRELRYGRVAGSTIYFETEAQGNEAPLRFEGTIEGSRITGNIVHRDGTSTPWTAALEHESEIALAAALAR